MFNYNRIFKPLVLLLFLCFFTGGWHVNEPSILVFSKTAGYRHSSIQSGIEAIQNLGQENGFTVDTSEDASVFTFGNLMRYDAIVFLSTTGDILNDTQQGEFERYIQAGGGYVGIHAATDTEYGWPWYGELAGAYFESHPSNPNVRTGTFRVIDKNHPSTAGLPDQFERSDEFYNFRSMNPSIQVLVDIDENTYSGGTHGDFHPMSWYHEFDGGRAWYTAMGHTDATFYEPLFLQHLLGGIQYAMGNVSTQEYELTVNGGTGSGNYSAGTSVQIIAPEVSNGIPFDRWTGDTQYVENIFSSQTSVTLPASNITINATYTSQVLREPDNPANALPQAAYEYYEQTVDFLPDFNTLTPTSTGTSPTISLAPGQRPDGFLLRYSGYIDAPSDGTYTFYTASDDGSQLFIGDLLIVDNDSVQSVQERSGEIGLKSGKHAFTVTYFERTGDEALSVSWAGPNISKQTIPASVFYHGGEGIDNPKLGDVSLNGEISALDASLILAHTIGQNPLEGNGLGVADVSGNGSVSAYDASLILQYVVGILSCFPADAGCNG